MNNLRIEGVKDLILENPQSPGIIFYNLCDCTFNNLQAGDLGEDYIVREISDKKRKHSLHVKYIGARIENA